MTDELVLYHSPFSRSYTAYWMLEELGRPYRVEIVDIRTGAQKRPEFLRLNPMGKVPTLSDGGLVLTERGAICAHLADKYAYGKLAPLRESPERSQYLRWLFFDAGVLEPAMAMRRQKLSAPAREVGWGDFDTMVSALSAALDGREFIVGDRLTAADVVLGSSIQVGLFNGFLPRARALVAYADQLAARPACKKAADATFAPAPSGSSG